MRAFGRFGNTNMRRQLAVSLFLSLALVGFAQTTKVGGSGKTKVGGSGTTKVSPAPSGATNLGPTTIGGSSDNWSADYAVLNRVQATGSGTLTTGFIYAGTTATQNMKVAVYTSSGASPAAGDTQVGISGTVAASGAAGWYSASMSGGTITNGNFYWVCVFLQNSGGGWQHQYGSPNPAGSIYYRSGSGYYASPPASNLSSVVNNAAEGIMSAYITVL